MTSPADDHGPDQSQPAYRNEGIRTLLDTFAFGDPDEHLPLGQILQNLQQSAFGMFLFVSILPAFIPIPGLGGAVSGPLVILIGLQLLCGLRKPWVPGFIGRRGPRRGTMQRFLKRITPSLQRLDRMLKPRVAATIVPFPARAFTGVLLVLIGLLLSLPIPFTNYLFGFQLLLFALALLERDGGLMLANWIAGVAAVVFFSLSSSQIIAHSVNLVRGWIGA